MIFRFAFFVALAFAFASCTSTDFQAWEGGNSVVRSASNQAISCDQCAILKS
jgi:hypothetical protein